MPVVVEADGVLVGAAGVHFRGGRLGPEIGYWIAAGARGRGYAAETAHALAEWALGLGAPRVHLVVDVANTASQVTAERAVSGGRAWCGAAWRTATAAGPTPCSSAGCAGD